MPCVRQCLFLSCVIYFICFFCGIGSAGLGPDGFGGGGCMGTAVKGSGDGGSSTSSSPFEAVRVASLKTNKCSLLHVHKNNVPSLIDNFKINII